MCDNQRNLKSGFAIIKGIRIVTLGLSHWITFGDDMRSSRDIPDVTPVRLHCMSSGKMGILREEIRGEFVPQKAW
jgi:hypothetical protein